MTASKYFCESMTGTNEGRFFRRRKSFPSKRGSERSGGISDGGGVLELSPLVSISRSEVIAGLGGGRHIL